MRFRDSLSPGMLIPLAIVAVLVTVVAVGLRASSGLRAYVGGESLWTKSQKSGVIALVRYAHTSHPADWVAYEDSRAIPEADRRARTALQTTPPDIAAAVTGFIAGGNHPDDARAMQWLFRAFARERHLQRAVAIWTAGDQRRDELHAHALTLRRLVDHSASADSLRPVLDSIAVVDARLTVLERDFSATLAEAGRWLHRVLLFGTGLVGLLLAAFGALSLSRLTREERRAHLLAQQRDAERLASERALRERDEQLRQSQKMEAVGRLAGGIAHDFNNLLTVMRGNLELLRMGLTPGSDAEQDLRETARAVDRAAALTSQLLTFSRQRAPDLQPLRLQATITSAQPMLMRALGDQVRLSIDVPEDLPLVLGDAAQLEQVLLNLAVNARDVMPDGGTLRVRAMRRFGRPSRVAGAPVLTDGPADWVVLEVSDSGPGVPEELRERIFEPFFTTKEVGKGTGLGLATTYGIVVGFGGAIEVGPSDFGGATFTLWLPPTEQSIPESRPLTVTAETGISAHVLVVEDQPEVRRLTSRILRRAGFHVSEATNGREAFELLAREPGTVDLIVSDVVMPEVGGRALAEALQKRGTPRPMIFISGYSPDQEPLCDPYGRAVEVLAKPFRADDLIERVRSELARARAELGES